MIEELERSDKGTALREESVILGGRYRLVQVWHQRPRVNLYLGRRLCRQDDTTQQAEGNDDCEEEREPLVAIRELVLTGLSAQVRRQVEQAAFEEFVSPTVLGSPRLPGAGDRVRSEGDRHYLIMQLRRARGERRGLAVTLADLLLSRKQWPLWLDGETALDWGIQLCRIMARLHRLGVVLGDLDPTTVLVDREGVAEWAPVLLVSWPPAPRFWPKSSGPLSLEQYTQVFPIAISSLNNAFVAPELMDGVCDERADVYSLGAILYLLFTRYAPFSALRRQGWWGKLGVGRIEYVRGADGFSPLEAMELIPPRLFNSRIPVALEDVLVRALALEPGGRYQSVFEMVEALEGVELAG